MLRTRFLVGLLPLVLVVAASGLFSVAASRELAGSLQSELAAGYARLLASERMRAAAAAATSALESPRADPGGGGNRLEETRGAFERDLHDQSTASAGGPRAALVAGVDAAFQGLLARAGEAARLADIAADEAALFRVQAAIDRLSRWDFDQTLRTRDRAGRLAAAIFRVQAAGIAAALLFALLMTKRVSRARGALGAALASAPDPVFVVNRQGGIETSNEAASAIARLPEFSEGFPPGVAGPLGRVLGTGAHHLPGDLKDVVTLRAGPEPRHYLPRIVSIRNEARKGGFAGAAVILQDVTRFRLLDDARTNLVGTVSHELKTPLTSLRMAVYLLLEDGLGPLEPGQREMLVSARDDADRLLSLLDALLDIARLEAGAVGLHRVRIKPADLTAAAAAEARALAAPAGLEIAVEVEPGLEDVAADPLLLRIVFSNLVANAVRFAPAGSPVGLGARRGEAGFVVFHVRDRGAGVPPESRPRIFERFYRAPGQESPGAGLGLAIAREIVVAHGGAIDCISRPGEGAEFRFRVPAWSPDPSPCRPFVPA